MEFGREISTDARIREPQGLSQDHAPLTDFPQSASTLPTLPAKAPGRELSGSEPWQRSLANAIRDPETLLRRLDLPDDGLEPARRAAALFPVVVPESYLRRMRSGDPDDPLLRQVLPRGDELQQAPGFVADPVQDAAARVAPGLLHKYAGRALLIAVGTCAIHCRYCFRRHYPYDEEPRRPDDWTPALEALRCDPGIHEIILSGGDPLVLGDRRLERLIAQLAEIPHLRRVRIHSRLPVVLPDRVTLSLIHLLRETRLQPVMVVHANHAREIVADCADALRALVEGGIPTLNQAVLLRGINDSVDALAQLCEALIDLGVMPYYLHQLDRVLGAAHFEVSDARARELVQQLQTRLPGYAVPRLVRELPGAEGKTPLL